MSSTSVSRSSKYICRACRAASEQLQRRRYGTNTITSNPASNDIYDVVTVGGGPVGLALLAAIKSSPSTSHLKCALIEVQPLDKQKSWTSPEDVYSNRASSITSTNQSFLESIGAWRHLDLQRVQPYDEMQVWDAGNDSAIQFDWSQEAVQFNAPLRTIATMVENANLSRALLRRLDEVGVKADGGEVLSGWSVKAIGNGIDDSEGIDLSSWPVLQLESKDARTRQIATRLLIGADGINSPVRTFAGINTHGWDYGRNGVVATLKIEPETEEGSPFSVSEGAADLDSALEDFLSDETDGSSKDFQKKDQNITPSNRATAFQRFLPSLGGPIAILPLPNNHASLVWSTTPQVAGTLKSLSQSSPQALTAIINAALRLEEVDVKYLLSLSPSSSDHADELRWRLQNTKASLPARPPPRILSVQEGSVAPFPLRLRNATSYIAPHVALAGDAAHTIHPLAGQGLNLGLGDAEALARTVTHAVEHGMDIGDLMTLEKYTKERYPAAVQMSSGVDALNSIYQMGQGGGLLSTVLGRARGLGMWAVGAVPGVKEAIMRRAD